MNATLIKLRDAAYYHYYTEAKSRKMLLDLALKEIKSTGHTLDDVVCIFGFSASSYEEYKAMQGLYTKMKVLLSVRHSLNGKAV